MVDFGGTYLEETGHLIVSADDDAVRFGLDFAPLVVIVRHIPSAQPRFTLPILQ